MIKLMFACHHILLLGNVLSLDYVVFGKKCVGNIDQKSHEGPGGAIV